MSIENGIRTKIKPPVVQVCADTITILGSSALHYYIRFLSGYFSPTATHELSSIFEIGIVLLCYWLLLFWFAGLYKDWYVRSPFDEIFSVFRIAFLGSLLIFSLVYLDSSQSSKYRLLFLIYFIIFCMFVISGRMLVRLIQKKLRTKKLFVIPVLMLGTAKEVKLLYEKIIRTPSWGFLPIGVVMLDETEKEAWNKMGNGELPLLGVLRTFKDIIGEVHPKEVLIALRTPEHSFLLDVVTNCAEKNISVKIEPDLYDLFSGQARTLPLYGIPLIEINAQLLKPWEEAFKRMMDILSSLVVIIAGIPIWFLIAIIIKAESKGPVFFKQERVGKKGKIFFIYKFRSMVAEADKGGPKWTKIGDTRVTKFGKIIRRSHLDEVPQFWNVLKGEMSLVGPRPEQSYFVQKYSELISYYKRRLVVRPGITGWWQVKYISYEETVEEIESRLKDDFYYIENISLKLDLEIIIRTVFLVLKGHGQT